MRILTDSKTKTEIKLKWMLIKSYIFEVQYPQCDLVYANLMHIFDWKFSSNWYIGTAYDL